MSALASKSQHIPFRNSKLTQLLQDSLCGQAKVMMFMHISPEANMFGETVSTLKFATRVSEITLGQVRGLQYGLRTMPSNAMGLEVEAFGSALSRFTSL